MTLRQKHSLQVYFLAILLSLFQKGQLPEEIIDEASELDEEAQDFSRIRCPACRWQPRASNRWYCGDCGHPEYFYNACGTAWNTFDTRGRCPGCGHQWRWTCCLSCWEWSLHEDWYVQEEDSRNYH
jgi:hypothetical protein